MEFESGPIVTRAFIALSISYANLVIFPEAFVLSEIYFPLQKQLGYATSIPSLRSPLLNSDVHNTKDNCSEREFWDMQRILIPGLSF